MALSILELAKRSVKIELLRPDLPELLGKQNGQCKEELRMSKIELYRQRKS